MQSICLETSLSVDPRSLTHTRASVERNSEGRNRWCCCCCCGQVQQQQQAGRTAVARRARATTAPTFTLCPTRERVSAPFTYASVSARLLYLPVCNVFFDRRSCWLFFLEGGWGWLWRAEVSEEDEDWRMRMKKWRGCRLLKERAGLFMERKIYTICLAALVLL